MLKGAPASLEVWLKAGDSWCVQDFRDVLGPIIDYARYWKSGPEDQIMSRM